MTHREALKWFKQDVLPGVIAQYGTTDRPAKSEAWCVFVDRLHRDGTIDDKQSSEWSNPYGAEAPVG